MTVEKTRCILFEAQRAILKQCKGRTIVEKKYHAKMAYMMRFLSMIPCKSRPMDNWVLPDYNFLRALDAKESNLMVAEGVEQKQ